MRNLALVFAVLLHGFGGAAGAQSEAEAAIALELNRVDQIEGACRLTFMATNALGADVEALTVETVLIDAEGVVERLTLFEFGALPAGTPRVRQFDLPDLECGVLGRVLVNGVAECTGAEDCAERMVLSSRVDIELIG
jgi:hypothetical protein